MRIKKPDDYKMRDLRAERAARKAAERREHEGIKREMAKVLRSRLTNRDPQTGVYLGGACSACDGFGNAITPEGCPIPCPNGCAQIRE